VPIEKFIRKLRGRSDIGDSIKYHRKIPPKQPGFAPLPGLEPTLKSRLKERGLETLYTHQADAINRVLENENVIVSTPTASGKTLCYMALVINEILKNPETTALFLFPLKALAHDQIKSFKELAEGLPVKIRAEIFDGDTKQAMRKKIVADPPNVIFTNPDMLHLSILPYHGKWETFIKRLKFVVIDETHTYRGVFGSHVAQVLRRLNRITARYKASPTFIATSATISNPGQFAETLTGKPFRVIDNDASPKPGGHFIVYNTEASPYTDASKIFRTAINENLKTIVFTKARKITELIYQWTAQAEPKLAERVTCYRAGFLAEERRTIEHDLFTGKLDGVVTTSALEMGVDIGGLDVCVLVGYPGTIINTWQRGGRVGRGDREFLIILIAQPDALDQYFVHHPDELFSRGFEAAIIDPGNEPILKNHIVCAASELPIEKDDGWLKPAEHMGIFDALVKEGRLVISGDDSKWLCPRRYPHRDTHIRSIGESYSIFGDDGKTLIGHMSGSRVFGECHEGAVYLHRGQQYLVSKLDPMKKTIHTKPMDERYYTRARSSKETEILGVIKEKEVNGFTVKLGRLKVTEQVTGYEKRSIYGQEPLGVFDLDSPVTEFETVGFWVEIGDAVKNEIERRKLGFMGGIHAFEHGAIALFPLFALCDRNDIGGISYPLYPGLGKSAVFFYDGYTGGLGLCKAGFEKVEMLWKTTLSLIADCECDLGCPSCIHSPKCGSGNKPLDKRAAVTLLEYLAGVKNAPADKAHQKRAETALAAKVNQKTGATPGRPPLLNRAPDPLVISSGYYDPAPQRRILIFDLETKKSADEVGGWGNVHLMELAVGVVYDSLEKKYIRYFEEDVNKLVTKLLSADLVVGFNHVWFDYGVLKGYTDIDLATKAKSFDILSDIRKRLGYRLSLNHLAQETLNKQKTADGLVSLQWWKEGKREQVADYCEMDVAITKELFEFGLEHGRLLYRMKNGESVRLNLDWDIDAIITDAAKGPPQTKRRIRF